MLKCFKPLLGNIIVCDNKNRLTHEVLSKEDRFSNILLLGPEGSGKTSQSLLPMAMQDIQNPDWGVTVLEPRDDLAVKVHLIARRCGRKSIYFDPTHKDCPKFNPLFGPESDVIENMVTAFDLLDTNTSQVCRELNAQLLRKSIKVLKRLDRSEGVREKYSTLIYLDRLIHNLGGEGKALVYKFAQVMADSEAEAVENAEIMQWFLYDYFPEGSDSYRATSNIRFEIAKLVSNKYLRTALNPEFEKGERHGIDFERHLACGDVLCISTARHDLHELSKYLDYFFILTLQSTIARRPGTPNTRRPHSLYLDEFQAYATQTLPPLLSQSHLFQVSFILAAQSHMQIIASNRANGTIFDNIKNVILYPGINLDDALYYSEQFGVPKDLLVFGKRKGRREGQIVYRICKNGVPQRGKIGYTSFIPKEMNTNLHYDLFAFSLGSIKAQDFFTNTHFDISNPPTPSPAPPEIPICEALKFLDEPAEQEVEMP